MFDTSEADIRNLRSNGKTVICYISAGSWEKWRKDGEDFPEIAIGKSLDGWPDEKWLDTRNGDVRSIIEQRFLMAQQKGCHGIEPDNVDGWDNETGFSLTKDDSKDYLTFLSTAAHNLNLLIGLKNAAEIVSDMQPLFDFAIVEECK